MRYWTQKLVEREEEYEWARRFLCQAESLQACENYPGTYRDGPKSLEDACTLANAQITRGELCLKEGRTPRDITDLLESAYDDNCP